MFKEAECRDDESNLALLVAHAHFFQGLAEDALAMSRRRGNNEQIGKCLLGVAQVHVMTKNGKDAQQTLDEALELARKIESASAEAYAHTLNAQLYWALKQEDLAPEPARRALELFLQIGDQAGAELAEEMT